jgi:uncharacterized protein YciI
LTNANPPPNNAYSVISDERFQRLQVTAASEQNHLNLLNPLNPLFPLSGPFLTTDGGNHNGIRMVARRNHLSNLPAKLL